jgi:anti-sigma regulatory factor (Ser/Thr protein kinase)
VPPDAEADEIILRVPTTPPMASVVRVAVRVLAGRAGLADTEIEAARRAAGDAYDALVDAGDAGPVEIHVRVRAGRLRVELTGVTGTRSVTAPR